MHSINGTDLVQKSDSNYEKKLLTYLLQCILSEGSKIILFTVFALYSNCLKEFLAALILLILLRTNGGGIHCRHYFTCLVLSFTVLFGSIVLAVSIPPPAFIMQGLTFGCALMGHRLAPVSSANRPPADSNLIEKCKRNTLVIILIVFTIICIIPNSLYSKIGFWTIILHISQLLLAKFSQKGRKE